MRPHSLDLLLLIRSSHRIVFVFVCTNNEQRTTTEGDLRQCRFVRLDVLLDYVHWVVLLVHRDSCLVVDCWENLLKDNGQLTVIRRWYVKNQEELIIYVVIFVVLLC
jgi:hypothetical protein